MSLVLHFLRLSLFNDRFRRSAAPAVETQMITLPTGSLWSAPARPGTTIRCTRGTVWLTQSNNPRDILLSPGDSFTCTYPGKLIATPLRPATLQIQPSSPQQARNP